MIKSKRIPDELTIDYQGEKVMVAVLDRGIQRRFGVFFPEEATLVLHVQTDAQGNETWYEGAEPTPLAGKLGELIEGSGYTF
jgi:hypothetical protein